MVDVDDPHNNQCSPVTVVFPSSDSTQEKLIVHPVSVLPWYLLQQSDNSMEIFWLFKMAAALPIQHF
jgi:hypothetical protein